MREGEANPSRSVAIRREVVATFMQLRNEEVSPRGLVEVLKRNQRSGTGVSTELEMHFVILPLERQFGLNAATFRRQHDSGELLNRAIPSESSMVTFLGLCHIATDYYGDLLNRRPYQTISQVSA